VSSALAAPPEGTGKRVRGKDLKELFLNTELSDGAHFAYAFQSDGTFSGVEMGRDVRGTWRTQDSEVCIKWAKPPGAKECYVVRKKGAELSLFRNGVEAWYGTLKSSR
jgi:hypothetical protein